MKSGGRRWVLPYEQWPPMHREAWQAVIDPGDVFCERGLASCWTDKTCRQIVKDYGMWLKHWSGRDPSLLASPEPIALTPDNLRPYVSGLQDRLAPVSVCSRLRGLSQAYRVMWPDAGRTKLNTVLSRLKRNANPSRNKQALVMSSREILNAALDHMDNVIKGPARSDTHRASRLRDALMVALLAVHPIRLANLTRIRLGRHLTWEGDEIWLRFSDHETKERQPLDFPLAPVLIEPLELYLRTYRTILLDGRESDALWISIRKGPMKETAVYEQVVHTTERLFGHPINPHLFRDCAMTTLATDDPAHIRVGARLLGHNSLKSGEQHYNHATMLSAVAQYHETLAQLRGSGPPTEDPNP